MKLLTSLWQLMRSRAERRLAKQIQKECAGGLLILISTRSNFRIVRELARITPLWISAGKLASEHLWQVCPEYLRTPSEIVRLAATHEALPRIVVSFPDQMQGDGPSFVEIEYAGAPRHMSLLELLLVMRHQPSVHTVLRDLVSDDMSLHPIDAAASRQCPLDQGVKRLLGPIETLLANPPHDWLAERVFASKSAPASAARFRDDVRDVEALLRLLAERTTPDPYATTRIMNRIDLLTRGPANANASSSPAAERLAASG